MLSGARATQLPGWRETRPAPHCPLGRRSVTRPRLRQHQQTHSHAQQHASLRLSRTLQRRQPLIAELAVQRPVPRVHRIQQQLLVPRHLRGDQRLQQALRLREDGVDGLVAVDLEHLALQSKAGERRGHTPAHTAGARWKRTAR